MTREDEHLRKYDRDVIVYQVIPLLLGYIAAMTFAYSYANDLYDESIHQNQPNQLEEKVLE
jgi:hypothetical protein